MLPYIIQTTNVSYVQFKGLVIAGACGAGVQIFNSSFVSIVYSTIVDVGTVGASIPLLYFLYFILV
jgi:hypothetical protein